MAKKKKITELTQEILNGYDFKELRVDRSDIDFVERFVETSNGFKLSYYLEIEQEEDCQPVMMDEGEWIQIETKEELDAFLSKTKKQVLDWIEDEHYEFIREDYIF